MPEEDWNLLFRWTNEIIAPEDPEFQRGRSSMETSESARMELFAYFKDLAERRRRDPKDDILTAVVQGRIDGKPLPDFELLSYYFLLVVAGNETTRNAMTGGVQCLLDHPGEWHLASVGAPGCRGPSARHQGRLDPRSDRTTGSAERQQPPLAQPHRRPEF